MGAGRIGPVGASAAVLAVLVVALHLPVFARGALITPAGMHYGQWPWKPYARLTAARGAVPGENSTLSDLLFQVYPWQLYTVRSLREGRIPLWNPYSYCGAPFVANAQSAVFYPLHWPAWILPSMRVFTAALLLKILLAGSFMAVFLRGLGCATAPCVVGSVSFALCGFMTAWLGYAHTNAALALPLLMHAARLLARAPSAGPFLLLAFSGAAQYLGGHPETSLHIMSVSFLYFLWNLRRGATPRLSVLLFGLGALAGVAMAALQLLPFLEYLRGSAALQMRRALPGMDPDLPADAALALALPEYFGSTLDRTYHGPAAYQAIAGYAGVGVLLLAVISLRWWRETCFLKALALACAAVVYGPPAVRGALRVVPVIGIASNNRLLLVLGFCLAALAAHSLQRIGAGAASAGRRRGGLLAWLAGGAFLVAGLALAARGADPSGARLAAAIVGGTGLLAALAVLRPSRAGIHLVGIAAIVSVDLFIFAYGFNPHADPNALFPTTGLTEFLRRDSSADAARGGRLMTVGWTMRPETQMVYRLSSIEGYDAMEPAPYRRLLDRAGVEVLHRTGEVSSATRPLLDLLGLRYLVAPPDGVVSGEAMRLAYDGPDGRVFVNERAHPRLSFAARGVTTRGDRGAALELLAERRVDPEREVLLDGPAEEVGGPPGAAPAIILTQDLPGSLRIQVRGQTDPGFLVVGDAWNAGWTARVNEVPAEVLRANHVFMAVRVPAGEAEVELTYRPASFRLGLWISALSLLASLAVALARPGGTAGAPPGRRESGPERADLKRGSRLW